MTAMVGHDLHFDMAGLEKIPFEIDAVIAECGFGFGLGGLKRSRQIFGAC